MQERFDAGLLGCFFRVAEWPAFCALLWYRPYSIVMGSAMSNNGSMDPILLTAVGFVSTTGELSTPRPGNEKVGGSPDSRCW